MITINKNVKEAEKTKRVTLNDLPIGTTFTGGLRDFYGTMRYGLWVKLNGPTTFFKGTENPRRVDVLVASLTPGIHSCGGRKHSLHTNCQEIINFKEVDVEITIKEK